MTFKVQIMPAAKKDIREAAKWYNNARKGLGKQFTTRIRERVTDLEKNPLICQLRYKKVHTALVRQFPYLIHYTVDKKMKIISVIAVLSSHRDPKIWDTRSE